MKYNSSIFRKKINTFDGNGSDLYNFIAHYSNEYKLELVHKLGFNQRSFKEAGKELLLSSIEIDFNYPVRCSEELIIKIEFLDIRESRFRIISKMHNPNGSLVASAVTTFIVGSTAKDYNHSNLRDYFNTIDEEFEELAVY